MTANVLSLAYAHGRNAGATKPSTSATWETSRYVDDLPAGTPEPARERAGIEFRAGFDAAVIARIAANSARHVELSCGATVILRGDVPEQVWIGDAGANDLLQEMKASFPGYTLGNRIEKGRFYLRSKKRPAP